MTRRDYVKLAAALREARAMADNPYTAARGGSDAEARAYSMGQSVGWWAALQSIADTLAADNPRFSRDRFMDAADVQHGEVGLR